MQLAPGGNFLARQARLRDSLTTAALDALVVSSLPNIAYLTGLFASTAVLVFANNEPTLLVDARYLDAATARQADLEGLAITLIGAGGSFEESIATIVSAYPPGRVGIEASHMTVRAHQDLERRARMAGAAAPGLVATDGMVEQLRSVKDPWELGRLREAAARLSDVAKCIIPKALAGMRERDVAGIIESELRRVGFDRPAFDTIVAAGPNSAVPHHRGGDRQLEAGDLVVLDFGGMLDGYAVDLSRTIAIGPVSARAGRMLDDVVAAQQAAFDAIGLGRPATEVDEAARRVLEQAGLGAAFSHGTGHGLGLEVHERPRITRARPGLPVEPLEAGMVFTLEPGAYVAGWGGVRIEDDVAVTPAGAEWLTDVPRLM